MKSLSMAMGIRRPGFQLLSLLSSSSEGVTAEARDSLCIMPDQIGVYLSVYLPLIGVSLVLLWIKALVGGRRLSDEKRKDRDRLPLPVLNVQHFRRKSSFLRDVASVGVPAFLFFCLIDWWTLL